MAGREKIRVSLLLPRFEKMVDVLMAGRLKGHPVPRDIPTMIGLCRLMLKYKINEAARNLGQYYEQDGNIEWFPVRKNPKLRDRRKMFHYLRLAASWGDVLAASRLGYEYKNNHRLSVYWARRAARGGDSCSIFNLGQDYHYGWGVKKDPKKALAYWRRAAELRYPQAYFSLGLAYWLGEGTRRDLLKARMFFRQAARYKVRYAKTNLRQVVRQIRDGQSRKSAK